MNNDKFKLKEEGENPCDQCGSHKYTQTINEDVFCKECLTKIFDRALNAIMAKL